MPDLFDLRFVTVVGKGGVGKTTTSAALAMAAARRGKRVLVAMCNTKERLSNLLEVSPIDHQVSDLLPGIRGVNMVPRYALEEYGMMVLKVRPLYKAVFENRLVTSFLRGIPGLEAWSMLGKAFFHAKDMRADGSPEYDMVILDSPATGHGLEMLRVPKVLLDVAPPGLLRREAEQAWELFTDPARAGALMVTLPEDMPANETIELHQALTDELALPVSGLVVNGIVPPLFNEQEQGWVEQAPLMQRPEALRPLLRAAHRRLERERVQQDAMDHLAKNLDMPRYEFPMLLGSEFKRAQISTLSRHLEPPPSKS